MEAHEQPKTPETENYKVSLESASKILAATVVAIYGCGFLITSLHNFQYGFSEMNPFRPRILTAGGWFFVFVAVPFALLRQLTESKAFHDTVEKGVIKLLRLFWVYYFSCLFLVWQSGKIFRFDADPLPSYSPTPTWKVIGIVIIVIAGSIACVVAWHNLPKKWARILVALGTVALIINFCRAGFNDLVFDNHFNYQDVTIWLLLAGAGFYLESIKRDWKLSVGDWPSSMVVLLFLLTVFATKYYPHILASWGGGVPIPITITYSKDAVKTPSQDVGYLLLDETEAGFYVVGLQDKTATYVPRSSVGLVRFDLPPGTKQP